MMYRLAAAAGFLALSSGLVLAQTPAAKMDANTDKDLKEYQRAAVSKVTLAQALTTAEQQGEKGRAIDADFEKADGKNPNHYSIKVVYPDGKLVEYGINADDGALYKTENQPIERYFTRLKPADFQKATTSLKDALKIAEQKAGGGKAYEAEVEREGASVQYDIKVALPDREQKVKVGPDGKVVD
ncbi:MULTISPECIES: PepSY domain-containing protein [unclassified Methylobacterium]|uniref:PepSY domain-containing protein n=1 Tax=unclassified Methylobacterium TaxID=2615210 RepID=UPI0006FC9366|nr:MULTISPECIES: PepSY domain-containing protein [unclassified Methylobacterium]KQO70617.1 peptidase M4 [Methylobacterium sp. Leaf88]KQO72233.1 peptidase M4 [Methylobacterium sp. Leaf89]KQP68452.1 peptidase M4 [Methylobacterium sp. Leaf111]KQT70242.1 peptidase M4 [Methylobacterium sp. Leaf465]KQU16254.1 peptidase M4 [Methylobacterium sp. Leaf94]